MFYQISNLINSRNLKKFLFLSIPSSSSINNLELIYRRSTNEIEVLSSAVIIITIDYSSFPDPTYSHVKHIQLQTLFAIGEFEYSLIHAHQGFQKHPTTDLEHGILQGNETIEDCIGIDTSPITLQLLYPWIRELQEYRKFLVEKLKEEVDELAGIAFGI